MACYLMRPAMNNVFSQVFDRIRRESIHTNAGRSTGAVTLFKPSRFAFMALGLGLSRNLSQDFHIILNRVRKERI